MVEGAIMNAPFCKGDVVVRVRLPEGMAEAPDDTTVIGKLYIVDETKEHGSYGVVVRVVGHRYIRKSRWHRHESFRLYEPPKAEDNSVDRAMDAIAGRIKKTILDRLHKLVRGVE